MSQRRKRSKKVKKRPKMNTRSGVFRANHIKSLIRVYGEVKPMDDEDDNGGMRFTSKWRFPFPMLKIGTCFVVKGISSNYLSPYVAYAKRRLGHNYKIRTQSPGEVYVWRIS